ncbi:MAG: hypothetical protein LIO80_00895 [Lachnospiraceae bacterium]|nr:hypothetical protein [Lachnospiraceae bacterium]
MKKMMACVLIAGMCAAAAGCGSSSSDTAEMSAESVAEQESEGSEADAETEDTEETVANSSGTSSSSSTQSGTSGSGASSSGSSGSGTSASDSSGSGTSGSDASDSGSADMAEDEFVGNYVNGDTGMYLEIETSDSGESDYTLTWSNGTDWDSSYNALAQDGELIVTIEMNYDAVLTIVRTSDGLSITGDDNYYNNVVENRPLDGDFEKY